MVVEVGERSYLHDRGVEVDDMELWRVAGTGGHQLGRDEGDSVQAISLEEPELSDSCCSCWAQQAFRQHVWNNTEIRDHGSYRNISSVDTK